MLRAMVAALIIFLIIIFHVISLSDSVKKDWKLIKYKCVWSYVSWLFAFILAKKRNTWTSVFITLSRLSWRSETRTVVSSILWRGVCTFSVARTSSSPTCNRTVWPFPPSGVAPVSWRKQILEVRVENKCQGIRSTSRPCMLLKRKSASWKCIKEDNTHTYLKSKAFLRKKGGQMTWSHDKAANFFF